MLSVIGGLDFPTRAGHDSSITTKSVVVKYVAFYHSKAGSAVLCSVWCMQLHWLAAVHAPKFTSVIISLMTAVIKLILL